MPSFTPESTTESRRLPLSALQPAVALSSWEADTPHEMALFVGDGDRLGAETLNQCGGFLERSIGREAHGLAHHVSHQGEWIRSFEHTPLDQVVELHISGGSMSDPAWLPAKRQLRLDSHDTAVPEPVWKLLDQVLPRCENLRGVTLERMEGTVRPEDVGPV